MQIETIYEQLIELLPEITDQSEIYSRKNQKRAMRPISLSDGTSNNER